MIITNNSDYAEMAVGLRTNFPFGEKIKRQVQTLGEYHKPSSPAFMHAGDAWDFDWKQVEEFGSSYRMSTPQAAVGRIQLRKLENLNDIRKMLYVIFLAGYNIFQLLVEKCYISFFY